MDEISNTEENYISNGKVSYKIEDIQSIYYENGNSVSKTKELYDPPEENIKVSIIDNNTQNKIIDNFLELKKDLKSFSIYSKLNLSKVGEAKLLGSSVQNNQKVIQDLKINHFPESCSFAFPSNKHVAVSQNLLDIYLDGKNLFDLTPEHFKDKIATKNIYARHNKFCILPICLCQMNHLQELRLDYNKITEIPSQIMDLKSLKLLFQEIVTKG